MIAGDRLRDDGARPSLARRGGQFSHGQELTSQEAAGLLGVSRPHLIKLLDRGELPFHRVGTHRRIRIEDVLEYRERRRAERKAGLDELARLSEHLPGGYR